MIFYSQSVLLFAELSFSIRQLQFVFMYMLINMYVRFCAPEEGQQFIILRYSLVVACQVLHQLKFSHLKIIIKAVQSVAKIFSLLLT